MKRTVSIGLLCLLLFNTIGYSVLFFQQQRQARQQLRHTLDTHLSHPSSLSENNPDWVVFRMPIGLYHQPDKEPVAVEGEFEHQGKIYEKAFMGIKNDTIIIYCVNNKQQERVKQDMSDHAKTLAMDYSHTDSGKTQKNIKSFTPEYLPVTILTLSHSIIEQTQKVQDSYPSSIQSVYLEAIYPPPRQA
ncbi:hypothetical protein QNI16_34395 [Cytophagaceae bacterium YF14B1]|uniref:Uncharacterized protein n=1 Tax=Xanthocytophaga flava TaxID=3048013 RepID=A0AAE3QUH2_9BACT|nr:hypothetical protein [Xanthocytophaga flavus]MDJ1485632.1 hypothetical protein [Xanthocytophaga flavus]